MHLNGFDLNLLIALDALLRERNVTRAAERVFVSQPTMSTALQRLREYFGDPLLVRVGRELELTARGAALVAPVREALLHVETTLGTQPVFDPATVQRSFSAILPSFVVPWLIPPVLQHLAQAAPGIRLHIKNWVFSSASQLVSGEIDFLIAFDSLRLLGLPNMPDWLCNVELRPVRWVCAVSADHPLVGEELTREQFLELPHIYVRTPGDQSSTEEAMRRELRTTLDVRATTENVLQVPFMLPGTSLLAVMPENLALQLRSSLSIRLVKAPEDLLPKRRIDLLWHRRNSSDPGHLWLREMFRGVAANVP